uniref:Uncharacterized protein n=1 Tax=viral metagenome TaxID=1070528 RepID=A0A6C0B260_9ZZZZ
MAGRPRVVRNIQSYINRSDANSGLSMLKAGTAPKVGVTHYLWYNLQSQCTQGPLDFVNSKVYYNTLQWQTYGNLRPSFVPSPRHAYTNFPASRYASATHASSFNGNYNLK